MRAGCSFQLVFILFIVINCYTKSASSYPNSYQSLDSNNPASKHYKGITKSGGGSLSSLDGTHSETELKSKSEDEEYDEDGVDDENLPAEKSSRIMISRDKKLKPRPVLSSNFMQKLHSKVNQWNQPQISQRSPRQFSNFKMQLPNFQIQHQTKHPKHYRREDVHKRKRKPNPIPEPEVPSFFSPWTAMNFLSDVFLPKRWPFTYFQSDNTVRNGRHGHDSEEDLTWEEKVAMEKHKLRYQILKAKTKSKIAGLQNIVEMEKLGSMILQKIIQALEWW